MAETVLTSEQIEEFTLINSGTLLRFFCTKLSRFSENLFMGDRPSDTGNGNRNNKKSDELNG